MCNCKVRARVGVLSAWLVFRRIFLLLSQMKLFFLSSLVSASPFSDWLREEKANTYVSTGFLPCFGLKMPLVQSDGRRTISLRSSRELIAEEVTLGKIPTRDEMMKVRCGDVAFAFSKMNQVDFHMPKKELEHAAMPFIDLLYKAMSLRKSDYQAWIAASQLIPEYAAAQGPDDIRRNAFSLRGFTPFEVSREEAEIRLAARIGTEEAKHCRDMKIPGLIGTLSAEAKWMNRVEVYLENLTIEFRPQTNIGSLTCRQLMDVVSEMNLPEGFPEDIFELRELLRDPAERDDFITKSGGMSLTFSDGSKLLKSHHSLAVFCHRAVYVEYSSRHLEYEDKPWDFYPPVNITGLCVPMRRKFDKFDYMLSRLVSV